VKKYYNENKEKYKQELSRDVEYVVFSVVPTLEDDNETRESINALKDDFANYDDYLTMVRRNSDNTRVLFNFQNAESLKNDSAFSSLLDKDKGSVIGPYKTTPSTYRITKLVDTQQRPDSVEARHILISPTATKSLDSVKIVINDIKKRIESGQDFAFIAQNFSDDKNSAIKGGELGWFVEGQMVDIFNEVCFTSDINKLNIIETQFGVHLVQVINKSRTSKKYKIAYIDRNVSASTETYNNYYTEAAQFVSQVVTDNNPFDSIVNKENLVKRSDVKVVPNKENITGLANSRSVVKWMNNAEVGDVSEVFEFDNSYVVAKLINENKEGYTSLEELENSIKEEIRSDKKHEVLVGKMEDSSNLEELSELYNINIVKDVKAQLSLLSVNNLGYVPEVIGTVYATEVGETSSPIKSKNSLIFVRVNSRDQYRSEGDFSQEQSSMLDKIKNYAITSSFKALQDDANLIDNRSEVY
jgi:peptidyl-prolyl cis-trans isomerase D